MNVFGSNTAVFALSPRHAAYRAHLAAHEPNQHARDDSKHHDRAALGQAVNLPSLQHRSEDKRDRHPQQRQRHVQRQILLLAVASVGRNRRAAAWPARHAVDFEAVVGAVDELGVADVDNRSVLLVKRGKRGNVDVHDLHFGGDAIADAGFEGNSPGHAVERDVENAMVEQRSLFFRSAIHSTAIWVREGRIGLRFQHGVESVSDGHDGVVDKNRVFRVQIVVDHDLFPAQFLRLRLHIRVLCQIVLRLASTPHSHAKQGIQSLHVSDVRTDPHHPVHRVFHHVAELLVQSRVRLHAVPIRADVQPAVARHFLLGRHE